MTTPSGFDYKDDSVVAKLSIDVPSNTLNDLDQVRERAAAIKVELQAAARASGEWNSYLQQIPAITEQANQAYRNMITQLERMSYIQQEMGGGGNVGMQGAPMGGQPGGKQSTAAPQGYVDPFMGMPGSGQQRMTGFMNSMAMNDPRMFANMAAQRGNFVNPATLGLVGGQAAVSAGQSGGTGGGQGQGAPAPGSMSPQGTQKSRDAAAPPDQSQSGQPSTSERQREPADPHPDAPEWQKKLGDITGTATQVFNEVKAGSGRGGGLMSGGAAVLNAVGRAGGGGGAGGASGMLGGNWANVAKGAGIAGSAVGLGLLANKGIQDGGEQIQKFANLGAESGGGAMEGMGFEMQARMMSMNPFLSLEQSRSVMQTALKNGYTGKEFDTVTAMMADNLKEMNMTSADSMNSWVSLVEKGNVSVQEFYDEMDNLKDLTRTDGNKTGQSQRNSQFAESSQAAQEAGLTGDGIKSFVNAANETFSDDQQLKGIFQKTSASALNNQTFLGFMREASNVKGVTSMEQTLPRMQEQGIDPGQALLATYKEIAQRAASGGGDHLTQQSKFYNMLTNMGISMSVADAYALFDRVMEKGFESRSTNRQQMADTDKGTAGERVGNLAKPLLAPLNLGVAGAKAIFGDMDGARDSLGAAGRNFSQAWDQGKKEFSGSERVMPPGQREAAAAAPSSSAGPGTGSGTTQTKGVVQGELRIVVDKDGNVRAPQSVQLSGSQKSINSGAGSGTLNNPSPGDPAFNHAYIPWGGGR